MEDLERLKAWLLTYPNWGDGTLYVDCTEAAPDNAGVFPNGLEQIKRTEDVLGNVTVQCRYHFLLYRVCAGQQDGTQNAAWLLAFQKWVQQQSAAGLAPRFGDVPAAEQLRAEKGKLQNAGQVGTGVYVVTLTADFMKVYEVNEYGEN